MHSITIRMISSRLVGCLATSIGGDGVGHEARCNSGTGAACQSSYGYRPRVSVALRDHGKQKPSPQKLWRSPPIGSQDVAVRDRRGCATSKRQQCVCIAASEPKALWEARLSVAKSTGRLDLSDFGLTEVPDAVFEIHDLMDLSLAGNRITVLPDKIGNLTQLKRLGLAGNLLQTLPDAIGLLENLEGLWVHGNLLQNVPDQIGNLGCLRMLALAGNQLKSLPKSICSLSTLENLSLAGNKLTELPDDIGNLRSLKVLALNGNSLRSLPASLVRLSLLENLWIQGNDLESLPEGLSELSSLRDMSVADNLLTSLPSSVGSMQSLQSLCIYGNQISRLPEKWRAARALRYLWMEGNPLESESLASVIPQLRLLRAVGIDQSQAKGVESDIITSAGRALRIGEIAGTGKSSLHGGYFKLQRSSQSDVSSPHRQERSQLLVVAFGSAPGVPNWGGLLKRVKESLKSKGSPFNKAFDILFVVDPCRSWFTHSTREATAPPSPNSPSSVADGQRKVHSGMTEHVDDDESLTKAVTHPNASRSNGDDEISGETSIERGRRYYFGELKASVAGYERVMMLGDSMGASAALMYSELATAVVAFCPQVDLTSASIRPSRSEEWLRSFKDNVLTAVSSSNAAIAVHCGDWSHDRNQAKMLHNPQVTIITHPINDHRLAKALDERGHLVSLVGAVIEKQIAEAYALR